MRIYW